MFIQAMRMISRAKAQDTFDGDAMLSRLLRSVGARPAGSMVSDQTQTRLILQRRSVTWHAAG
jgi:hypothetical protein